MISKTLQKIINGDNEFLFQNYGDRLRVCFVKGDGSFLYDQDNKKYIDFFSGIAVSSLGYSNTSLSKALHKQVDNILHSSNWYFNKEQIEAARSLSKLSFPGKTLFVNSGAEANEAAIKLARKFGQSISKDKYRVISFNNSFHGRTFGSLSATAQKKIRTGFGPIMPGFKYCPLNDTKSFEKKIGNQDKTCAIIIEMIQGEGGINIAEKDFIKTLFKICKKEKIITIVDEVQTGIGRTGKTFAYEHYNITPDIITLAKGLGGGVPIGAIHAKPELAKYLDKGSHGTTFGGNHLAAAAASAVLNEISKGNIINNTNKTGGYILKELNILKEKVDFIKEIRGLGLFIGIELKKNGADIVKKALKNGLIINCTAEKVLRIMPPLNISMRTVKHGLEIFKKILIKE